VRQELRILRSAKLVEKPEACERVIQGFDGIDLIGAAAVDFVALSLDLNTIATEPPQLKCLVKPGNSHLMRRKLSCVG
jgi:hypothetical protein